MKKYLAILIFLTGLFPTFNYAQKMNKATNAANSRSISPQTGFKNAELKSTLAGEPKKVFIHYMGWYDTGSNGRHWLDGEPRKPLIDYYNSHSWATQIYHILLSWSCGIDGLVVNIIDNYDKQSLKLMVPSIKRIKDIDSTTFKYEIAISNDDQGMDKVGIDSAVARFTFYRDSIINTPSYLKYNDTAIIFIWPYNFGADKYKLVLDSVFHSAKPKILWKEIEITAKDFTTSFYPWVQGFSSDGLNWGKPYLDWFYPTLANAHSQYPNLEFATGGVWAGFDDRNCNWGQNRWIDRQNGAVYDSTWNYIKTYFTLYPASPIPLKWVYVQTFNDFNEGTEIEPSAEFRYNYLISTINNINAFKNTNISIDTCKFEAALKIYAAADSIELKRRDSTGYYSCLRKAIKYLISDKYDSVFYYANCIITDSKCSECYIPGTNNYEYNVSNFEIYPNPADDKLCFENKNNRPYMVQIINILGNTLLKKQFTNSFETINISNIPKGIYLVKIIQDNNLFAKKIVVRQL